MADKQNEAIALLEARDLIKITVRLLALSDWACKKPDVAKPKAMAVNRVKHKPRLAGVASSSNNAP